MYPINPYETTYGSMINMKKVKDELVQYLSGQDLNDFTYEFDSQSRDVYLVFITGWNEEEKELPVWEHPYHFQDAKSRDVVAVDVRKYIKRVDEQPDEILSYAKDVNNLDFIIFRSLALIDFISGDIGNFRPIFKPLGMTYGIWFSKVINNIVRLNPKEELYARVVGIMFFSLLLVDEDDREENREMIIARIMNMKHGIPIKNSGVEKVLRSIDINQFRTIEDLVNTCKKIVDETKSDLIDINPFVQMISSTWYGSGSSETIIMATENPPTWLALMFSLITNRSLKNNKLALLMDKNKKLIDKKELDKFLVNYYQDRIVK